MQATKVHVHLFYGADPRFYRAGENIGCLYGYHHAESPELTLTYSRDEPENKFVRLARRGLKAALGFDFLAAAHGNGHAQNSSSRGTQPGWTLTRATHAPICGHRAMS